MLSHLLLRVIAVAALALALLATYDQSRRWLESQAFSLEPERALQRVERASPLDTLLPLGLLQAAQHAQYLNPVASLSAFRMVLAQDPMNAHLWSEYAVSAMYAGAFTEGSRASLRALELGGNTRHIMLEQSLLALAFEGRAGQDTLQSWSHNLSNTLGAWPRVLAYSATTRHIEARLCTQVQPGQTLGNWCQTIEDRRQYCERSGPIPKAHAKVCRAFGYQAIEQP